MNNDEILQTLDKQFSLNKTTAKVLVVGLGKTGLSVADYLRRLGLQFAIVDSRKKQPFNEVVFKLAFLSPFLLFLSI